MPWTIDDIANQRGKTFVVTGANTGIGFATAQALAAKHAKVVLACRNADKGAKAIARLKAAQPDADVELSLLDLASLASVREFAVRFQVLHRQLDGLINNAGVMIPPLGRTADGFETQFGCNFLGPFALTGLLLPVLSRTVGARVVTLSSIAHWVGRIDFSNLNAERGYSKVGAYAQSKLADLIFSYELQRRLQQSGASTISIAAHPGATRSDLARHNRVVAVASRVAQSAEAGALPSLRAALDPQAKGGQYYGPAHLFTIRGPAVRQSSSTLSRNRDVAAKLWEAAQSLTAVRYL